MTLEADEAITTAEPFVDQAEFESPNVATSCSPPTTSGNYNAAKPSDGLVLGGPIPGAFDVPGRARGEIPVWLQQLQRPNSDLHAGSNDFVASSPSPRSIEGIANEGAAGIDLEHQVYVAEISSIVPQEQLLVIEGVKTAEPRCHPRIYYYIAGFLVVAAVIVIIATHFVPSSSAETPGSSTNEPLSISALNGTPTSAPTRSILGGNMNWTIADAIDKDGSSVHAFVNKDVGDIFHALINRRDLNFTFFGMTSEAKLLQGLSTSLISKFILPLWNAHLLDGLEGHMSQGQVLATEDMYDGMILMSVSGYPLLIRTDPFRVNNESVSLTERNLRYKNGILHNFDRYPNPVVPWIGKSTFDVLLETNEKRSQDLSGFIALIEASPDFKVHLELVEGDTTAITLFVLTNDALATLEPNQLADPNRLLKHHIVAGNFGTKCWWTIPTGTIVSDTELLLTSQAGTVLELRIDEYNAGVTINGTVTIVQPDVFSEQGIMHVIDKPLAFVQI